jgi:hypothetical protein
MVIFQLASIYLEMDRIYSQMHAQAMETENLHYDLILKIGRYESP